VEFSQHWCDVVASAGASYEPRCRILNRLQTPKETIHDTTKQRIKIVQATCNEGVARLNLRRRRSVNEWSGVAVGVESGIRRRHDQRSRSRARSLTNIWHDKHVSAETQSRNYHAHAIRHIRHLISTDLAQTLPCSLILWRIDYCNALLHGVPANSIHADTGAFSEHCHQDCSAGAKAPDSTLYCSSSTGCRTTADDIQVSRTDVQPQPSHNSPRLSAHSAHQSVAWVVILCLCVVVYVFISWPTFVTHLSLQCPECYQHPQTHSTQARPADDHRSRRSLVAKFGDDRPSYLRE